ncbi:phosphoserine phosphatase-like [Penaeus monodon]|uniref:phosphoserine phosphatase-like n=1 Tax=Penaeus monodon TaxID=6687 RepID=UPI0018A6D9AC|nr:phosphoserine phosphatase-like [Penaeus monodon]
MPSKWIRHIRSAMNGLNNNIIPGECQLPSQQECMEVWRSSDAVCFDVDSTVITDEGLDQLAAFCGKGEEIKKIEANFDNSKLHDCRTHHKLTKDVGRLVSALHAHDVDVYLVSGGFRSLIAPVAKMLNIPLENIFANRLKFFYDGEYGGFDEAQLTSRSGGKAEVISYLKKKEGYSRIVMIGDGATDMEACPPADAFIGFGGNVVRESVRNTATWYVTDFAMLINELERKD